MRYLIDGCYGDGNVGDEALLRAARDLIRRSDPGACVCAVTNDPVQTARVHEVRTVRPTNPWGLGAYGALVRGQIVPVIREVRRCDCFVLGGGELFRDDVGLRATFGMFHRLWLARAVGKRVVAVGVGAQEPRTRAGRAMLGRSLRAAHAVVFRDPDSLRVARSLVGPAPHLSWAPDMVFSLAGAGGPAPAPAPPDPAGPLRLGVALKSLRGWHLPAARQDDVARAVVGAVKAVAAGRPVRAVAFAFAEADRPRAEAVRAELAGAGVPAEAEASLDIDAIRRSLAGLDGLIAMPLHASILAYAVAVPTISIIYDEKVRRLIDQFGMQEFGVSLDGIAADPLAALVERLAAGRDAIREYLGRRAGEAGRAVAEAVTAALLPAGRPS